MVLFFDFLGFLAGVFSFARLLDFAAALPGSDRFLEGGWISSTPLPTSSAWGE